MGKLIRFINQGIKHFFIIDGEYLGDGCHEFKNSLPDSFADSQFMAVLIHLSEEFADSLVVHETLHDRKDVILECDEGRACNLCGKVGRLAFPQPEQSLALLEDDLLRPASGVNPICLEESQRKVGCEKSAPWPALAATNEEEPDMRVRKDNIGAHVPASELTTVLLLTPLPQFPDDGRNSKVPALKAVSGLSFLTNLYHSDVVTFDMAGAYELDYLGTCEPTISQYIAKAYLMLDSPAYHLYGEVNLAPRVLVKASLDGSILAPLCAVSFGEFLLTHAVVAFPSFLTKDGEVEQHLADTICDAEEESLEAEDAAVFKMGVDTPDILHSASRLGKVRVINHQARVVRLVVTAGDDLRPELADDMVHQLAPVSTAIVEELIEHIFTTTKPAA